MPNRIFTVPAVTTVLITGSLRNKRLMYTGDRVLLTTEKRKRLKWSVDAGHLSTDIPKAG
jgi:hypothetical protein